jgi:hypothetical protein
MSDAATHLHLVQRAALTAGPEAKRERDDVIRKYYDGGKGLSPDELAEYTGLSRAHIYRIVRGVSHAPSAE